MKLFASGEAQKVSAPGEFLDGRPLGRVVGVSDLRGNNGSNEFGWCGVKAVVSMEGENYVLDFPEEIRLETDDGLALISGDAASALGWWPSLENRQQYGLDLFDLKG